MSDKKIAFLFPGQGAQYVGMGKEFIEKFSEARETFQEAEEILDRAILKVVLEGPEQTLTETKNSQVALFVLSVALLRVLKKQFPAMVPQICAGLSLGEYTALYASGRTTFEECLRVVQKRSQFMNEACEATKGTMAVVLGLNGDDVAQVVKDVNLPRDLWAANFNCPGQVVLSGTQKGIQVGSAAVLAKGAKRVLPLQVHGAFHSGLMQRAEDQLAPYLMAMPLKESTVAFVMNVVGREVKEPDQIRENLVKQVTHPVRWEEGIKCMLANGTNLFLEIGAGKALAGFNKRIDPQAKTLNVEKIVDLEELAKTL